jgi:hypothetical protein
MNLQEQIKRTKHLMLGINEGSVTFPIIVSGNYVVNKRDCDGLHAFNDNGKQVIGGMNIKVNKELIEIYKKGFNPDITSVDITVDSDKMSVKWEVTINKSEDGNAWVGIYSRGGASTSKTGYPDSISTESGHASISQCKKSTAIKQRGTVGLFKMVHILKHNPSSGCRIKQIFYKYTLKEYPKK